MIAVEAPPVRLLAYHGDPAIKAEYLHRVRQHRLEDQIAQGLGQYWLNGKGCAVGCTIHGNDHARYERELGIPIDLARLEDAIFEGLSNADAVSFPETFLESIPVGADLAMVIPRFLHWLLTSPEIDLAGKADKQGKQCIAGVANLYRRWLDGEKPPETEWSAAESAAESAAWSAESARSAWSAESAARSAESARSAWSARSAESARSAWSAARSAESARSAWSAESAAWSSMAGCLLGLLASSITEGDAPR